MQNTSKGGFIQTGIHRSKTSSKDRRAFLRNNFRKRLLQIENLEPRHLLSLPADPLMDDSSMMVAEGESTPQTAALTRVYEGLFQLEAFGRRFEEAATAVATVPQLLGADVISDGLDAIVDISAAIREKIRPITQPPAIIFADGNSMTTPSFAVISEFRYYVSLDGEAPVPLLVQPPAGPGVDNWVVSLNSSIAGTSLAGKVAWSKATALEAIGESQLPLKLAVTDPAIASRLRFSTTALVGTSNPQSFGQTTADVQFSVEQLTIRTDDGTTAATNPPIVLPNYSVSIPRNAGASDPVKTNDNASIQDLADDINRGFARIPVNFPGAFSGANPDDAEGALESNRTLATYLQAIVVTVSGQQRLALVDRTGSVQSFRIAGATLNQLGFVTGANVSDLTLPSFGSLFVHGQTAVKGINPRQLDQFLVQAGNNPVEAAKLVLGQIGILPSQVDSTTWPNTIVFPLNFSSQQNSSQPDINLDFNRTLDGSSALSALGNLEFVGSALASKTANVGATLRVGISLSGDDGSSVTLATPLSDLNQGLGLRPSVGIAGAATIASPVLASSASFAVVYKTDRSPSVSVSRSISVNRNVTASNTAIEDLIDDINTAIEAQGLKETLEAKLVNGRFHLRAVDRSIQYLELRSSSIATSTALGLTTAPVPNVVVVRSTDRLNPGQPPTDSNRVAYPDLVVQLGPVGSSTNFHVNLDQVNTIEDVITQINAQVPSSGFASLSGGQIVLRAGGPFRVVASVVGNQVPGEDRIINGFRSGAGEALGLLGSSQPAGSNHELRSSVPDRLDLSERVFLRTNDDGSRLDLQLGFDVAELNLGVATGFASLHAQLSSPLELDYSLGLQLKDPGVGSENDGRLTFRELINAAPADVFSSITTNDLTASGSLSIHGSLFNEGGTIGQYDGELVKLNLSSNDGSLDLDIDTSGTNYSDLLKQLQNLSPKAVVDSVLSVLQSLTKEDSAIGKAIRLDLPLLGTSLASALDFIDQLDEAVQEFVSRVDTELILVALNEVESAIANLPYSTLATSRARSAVDAARQQLRQVREATTENLKTKVSRFIATVSMLDREIRSVLPQSGAGSGGAEGEPVDDIVGEMMQKIENLIALLPTVNQLASRLADAVRSLLPDLGSVQFRFDIVPDFNGPGNGPGQAGQNLAIIVGLLIEESLTKSISPGSTSTSFGPVKIELDGSADLELSFNLGIGIAIEIPSDLNSAPIPHVLVQPPVGDTNLVKTGLSIGAKAVTPGGLTADVQFGSTDIASGTIDVSLTNGAQPASLSVALTGVDNAHLGSRPLSSLSAANLNATAEGSLSGNVEVTLLGQNVSDAVTLDVPLSSLLGANQVPSLQVNEAALSALLADIDFDLQTIIAGIHLFLDQLESLLRDRLGDIPFVGGGLDDLGGLIGSLRDNVVAKVQDTLKQLNITNLESAKTQLRTAIFTVLNETSFVRLRDFPEITPGSITAEDIDITLERDKFEIKAYVGLDLPNITEGFEFATNFAGLPISADGQVGLEVTLQAEAFLGLGIDRFQGFYLLPKPETHVLPNGSSKLINDANVSASDELALSVTADLAIAGNPSQLEIDLFLLKMQATDAGSALTATVGVNLGDTSTISLQQLVQQPPVFAGGGSATLNLNLDAILAGLPKVRAELRTTDWTFSFSGNQFQTVAPSLSLNNISLDLGDFLKEHIGAAAEKLRQVLDPIRPIINLLKAEVPGVSELSKLAGQGPITLLDIALFELSRAEASETRRFLNFVDALDNLQSRLPSTGLINFGSVSFEKGELNLPDWNLLAGNSQDVQISESDLQLSYASATVERIVQEIGRRSDEDPRAATMESAPADGLGIKFPIIDQPTKFIQLLLGQTVSFVEWDIPKLKFDFSWSKSFPVVPTPPISVEVGLNTGFELALGVGYDSRGLSTGNVLDGFFINDLREGQDIDELVFSMGASVAALLDIGIASAGIEGELIGRIRGNWRDPDGDGKLYVDEITQLAAQGLDCVIELSADLRAKLSLVWEVLFFDGSIEIIDKVLFETNNRNSCPVKLPAHISSGTPEDDRGQRNALPQHIADFYGVGAPGGIAPAGTLIIHSGHFADLRSNGVSSDTSEEFLLTRMAPKVVRVTGMGMDVTYGGVEAIVFDAGLGNDILRLKMGNDGDELSYRNFDIPIVAFGGDGNDLLYGGSQFDNLFGGTGDDIIFAGPGNDVVDGGDGGDTIYGDDGSDTIDAGAGDDFVYGEGDGDIIFGDEGNDTIWGGYLNNAAPPTGRQADGGDDLDAGPGQDGVRGGPGNDTVWGRGGDDLLYGDGGADTMDGGDGHDLLDGGTESDWIHAGLGNDLIIGGDGADILLGGWGNDFITAHTLGMPIGGTLSDTIEGGPDDDFICGSNGADFLYGGTSDDGFDGLPTQFPGVPFSEGRIAVMAGGYDLDQCTVEGPPNLPPPVPGSAVFRVFRDRNQDGVKNSTDFYDNGRLVRVTDFDGRLIGEFLTADIDVDDNGSIDPASERGLVQVPELPPGTYIASLIVAEDQNMTITTPNRGPGFEPVLIVTISDDQSVDGGEFGLYKKSIIQGVVWRDTNGNGVPDGNEERLPNRYVYLDTSPFGGNGNWDPPSAPGETDSETFAKTDSNGSYTIETDIEPGEVTVRLLDPTYQTFPFEATPYPTQNFTTSPVGPEWQPSPGPRTVSPSLQAFHGVLGNTTTTLVLNDLPDHEELELSFRLYIIGPWTGNGQSGGEDDRFRLKIVGGQTLLEATFSNLGGGSEFPYLQSFPTPGSVGRSGASTVSLGYGTNNDSVYRFDGSSGNQPTFKFDHFGPNLALEFRGINLETGEVWGIDSVSLVARKGGHIVNLTNEDDIGGVNFAINPPIGQSAFGGTGGGLSSGSYFDLESNAGVKNTESRNGTDKGYTGYGPQNSPPPGFGLVGGIRYNDEQTNNGTLDSSDPRIANQVVYVDLNGNGLRDSGEPRRKTNTRGEYSFELAAGTYIIREIMPEGWEETAPTSRPFAVSDDGKLTEVDPLTGAIVHTRSIASPVTISQWTGLSYYPQEGKLLATGNSSSGNTYLFEIDPITAVAVVRTRLNQRLTEGDLAVEPTTGRLLAVTSRTSTGSWLVEIDKQSGTVQDLSNFQTEFEGAATDPSAMAFRTNGWLYVIDRNYNRLYRLDPVTGAVISNPSLTPADSDNIGRVAGMIWFPSSSSSGNLRLVAGSPSSAFNPPDAAPSLYQVTTSGVVSLLNSSPIPEDLSGMTLVPGMGHIVTLVADEFDSVAPVTTLHFGNIPVKVIWDGIDDVEGHNGVDNIWGDNDLIRPRTRLIGDADKLIGGLGNDIIRGQQKDDILWGGPKTLPGTLTSDNDTLDGGEGWNSVVQLAASNQVLSNNSLTGQGTDSLTSIYAARLTAGNLGNTIDASAFTRGSVELIGGPGADTLIGSPQNDRLEGLAGNDTLDGRGGDDVYAFNTDTQLAFDTILSSTGIDTIDFSQTNLGATVFLFQFGAGTVQTVNFNLSLTLMAEDAVENIIGGSGNDVLVGNSLANRITGGPGNDDMSGLGGNDVFVFFDATGASAELDKVAGGDLMDQDTLDFSNLTLASSLVVDFRNGGVNIASPYATETRNSVVRRRVIRLDSSSTIEIAIGTDGDDTYFDGPGAQSYEGRGGNDRYVMANNTDVDHIVELPGGGTDRIDLSAFTTPLRIDLNSTLSTVRRNTSSPFNIDASITGLPQRVTSNSDQIEQVIGGSGRDRIFGNENDNTIDGGPGGDKLEGRAGNDIYVYRSITVSGTADEIIENSGEGSDWISFGETNPVNSVVNVDLGTGIATVGSYSVTWTGGRIENATGGNGDDMLVGANANNALVGGPGNDTLDGKGGSNFLVGGQGNDKYVYRELYAILQGSQYFFIPDFGQIFDPDLLLDSRGEPLLDANGQPQAVDGGKGDRIDLSQVNFTAGVTSYLWGTAGFPMVFNVDSRPLAIGSPAPIRQVMPKAATIGTQVFQTWIENVTGSPGADILTGNNLRNEIDGGPSSDTIYAYDGDDVLTGGAGTNTIYGGKGNDRYHFNWSATSDDTLLETADSVTGGLLTTEGSDTLDFSYATGSGTFNFNLSHFSTNSISTFLTPRTGTTIRLRDYAAGSQSMGRAFENLIGVRDQSNNLTGNESSNIVLGGSLADTLSDVNTSFPERVGGRDFLIGFQGVDGLLGGNEDDILIGGWVDFVGDGSALGNIDAEMAALIAIQREWVGAGSRATREANIRAGVGLPSLNARLKTTSPGQTVFDDGVSELPTINGGKGDNWIIEPPLNSPIDDDQNTVIEILEEASQVSMSRLKPLDNIQQKSARQPQRPPVQSTDWAVFDLQRAYWMQFAVARRSVSEFGFEGSGTRLLTTEKEDTFSLLDKRFELEEDWIHDLAIDVSQH